MPQQSELSDNFVLRPFGIYVTVGPLLRLLNGIYSVAHIYAIYSIDT
jgi:hypothetical protein